MTTIQFQGNGTEYFKIWIVNILLTILTLGIYHPWAKVRTRRYFYGNTELDNANFDYHATGKQLFLSYVIAMVIFTLYVVLGQVSPVTSVIFAAALFFAFPWIIWRGIRFNLRMSSYRNVRFGFNGNLASSYTIFLGIPLAAMFVFGVLVAIVAGVLGSTATQGGSIIVIAVLSLVALFAYPAFFALMNKITTSYITNGIQFGQGQFSADLKFKPFFMIMLKAMIIGIILSIVAILLIGALAYAAIGIEQLGSFAQQMENLKQGAEPSSMFFVGIFGAYALLIPVSLYVVAYLKARHRTYIMNETLLDDSISFESSLRVSKYFGISLTNFLLIIFTAGLAYPWAAVRHYRYLVESTGVNAPEGFDGYFSKQSNESALGEELTDAFDIDVGNIAF